MQCHRGYAFFLFCVLPSKGKDWSNWRSWIDFTVGFFLTLEQIFVGWRIFIVVAFFFLLFYYLLWGLRSIFNFATEYFFVGSSWEWMRISIVVAFFCFSVVSLLRRFRSRSRIFKNRRGILFVEDIGENGCKISPWLLFFFFHCGLRWKILRIWIDFLFIWKEFLRMSSWLLFSFIVVFVGFDLKIL